MRSFSQHNPIAVTVYILSVLTVSMFCMDPVILLLSLVGALGAVLLYTDRRGGIHVLALSAFAITALLNPLVSHAGETVLFVMNDMPITLQAVVYGATAGVMLAATVYWFCVFSAIMTSDKLLYLFGALSPKIALVLSMALSMLPRFARQMKRVQAAQTVLGRYNDDTLLDDVRGGVRVFSVTTSWALENGIVTADSMAARGYGIGKRSRFSVFQFRAGDAVLTVVSVALSLTALVGIAAHPVTYYPNFVLPPFKGLTVVGYAAFGILAILPMLIEGKERIKWARLLSKI